MFWKLDLRNKQLIRNAENGLKYLESLDRIDNKTNKPHILNIFSYEEILTNQLQLNKSMWLWNRLFTYSTCFNMVFIIFSVLGMFGFVCAVISIICNLR